jgi:hypothetical protein
MALRSPDCGGFPVLTTEFFLIFRFLLPFALVLAARAVGSFFGLVNAARAWVVENVFCAGRMVNWELSCTEGLERHFQHADDAIEDVVSRNELGAIARSYLLVEVVPKFVGSH